MTRCLYVLIICFYMWYPVWSSHHRSVLQSSNPVLRCGGSCLGITSIVQQISNSCRVWQTPTPSMASWNDLPWKMVKMVISMDSWWDIWWWSIESGYRIWDDIWKPDICQWWKFTNLTSATLLTRLIGRCTAGCHMLPLFQLPARSE